MIDAVTAEEAVRAASELPDGVGAALGTALVVGRGGPLVGAVADVTGVFVDVALGGAPDEVAVACGRLAAYGAAWVCVSALAGPGVPAAVEAVDRRPCRIAVVGAAAGVAEEWTQSAMGRSRGELVSRAAALAAQGGAAGVVCEIVEASVVAQKAASLIPIVAVSEPGSLDEAADRGAGVALVPPGASGRWSLDALLRHSG